MSNAQKVITYNPIFIGKEFSVSIKGLSPILQFHAEKFFKEKMQQIKEVAQQNLTKNGSVRYGDLKAAIEPKAYINTKDNFVWAGVGIDRKYFNIHGKRAKGKRKGEYIKQIPVKYAHLVEAGFTHLPDGSKVEGKPFLRPAVNQCGGDNGIKREITDTLKQVIKEYGITQ